MSEIGCHNMCHDCAHLHYDEVYIEESDDYGWHHECLKDVPHDKVENCPLFKFDNDEAAEEREILVMKYRDERRNNAISDGI